MTFVPINQCEPMDDDYTELSDAADVIAKNESVMLDPEQQAALHQLRAEPFGYLSGTAGTGKTFTARELAKDKDTVLAATTGIAAVNLGEGTTINALLRYFDTADLKEKYLQGRLHGMLKKLQRAGIQRIVLDEVSMMNADALTYVTRAIAEVNEGRTLEDVGGYADDEAAEERRSSASDQLPLGLTLVGDFAQLPPIPDKDPDTGKSKPIGFAFESPEWPRFHVAKLTKVRRQDNQDFVRALHAVREADSMKAIKWFTPDKFSDYLDDRFDGTTIFAKNDAVDRYNALRLDAVNGRRLSYQSERWGKQRGEWKNVPDVLELKAHALVMLLANQREYEDEDDARGRIVYCNGDLGMVQEREDGQHANGVWVTLKRNGQTVLVNQVTRQNLIPLDPGRRKELRAEGHEDRINEKQEVIGEITYMPMRVAYGSTVHKSQGLSLDRVQINIRDSFFSSAGMLFVSLSRARNPEGLRIVGNQSTFVQRCTVNPKVRPWL